MPALRSAAACLEAHVVPFPPLSGEEVAQLESQAATVRSKELGSTPVGITAEGLLINRCLVHRSRLLRQQPRLPLAAGGICRLLGLAGHAPKVGKPVPGAGFWGLLGLPAPP
jgi:hypothetical protein